MVEWAGEKEGKGGRVVGVEIKTNWGRYGENGGEERGKRKGRKEEENRRRKFNFVNPKLN